MEIGIINYSSEAGVKERLKYLDSKGANGQYPSVHGPTQDKINDRLHYKQHQIYFGCRRAYSDFGQISETQSQLYIRMF
jgi:hypothetical protein